MPYSERPPDIVFPDNDKGRFDAAHNRSQGVYVGLCDRFQHEHTRIENQWNHGMKDLCRNREPMGQPEHNWCRRCLAGFPVWFD